MKISRPEPSTLHLVISPLASVVLVRLQLCRLHYVRMHYVYVYVLYILLIYLKSRVNLCHFSSSVTTARKKCQKHKDKPLSLQQPDAIPHFAQVLSGQMFKRNVPNCWFIRVFILFLQHVSVSITLNHSSSSALTACVACEQMTPADPIFHPACSTLALEVALGPRHSTITYRFILFLSFINVFTD